MELLVTSSQMKNYEKNTINNVGIPALVLMERAAVSFVDFLESDILESKKSTIVVVCGKGNNGGDGFAIARVLRERDYRVSLVFPFKENECSVECKAQYNIVKNLNFTVHDKIPAGNYDVLVDALLGIGLNGVITGDLRNLIDLINSCHGETVKKVVSVDIPSGIHSDTGKICGCAIEADATITFGYKKAGLLLGEGGKNCGKIHLADIGIYPRKEKVNSVFKDALSQNPMLTKSDLGNVFLTPEKSDFELFPKRDPLGHKGTFGRVLCVTGSPEMPGAAILNGWSVLCSGAGLVHIMTEKSVKEIVLNNLPEATVSDYDELDNDALLKKIGDADCVVLGCGLTQGDRAKELLEFFMTNCPKPLVLDADGLNILAANLDLLSKRKRDGFATILTPHPGEFKRLFPGENWEDTETCKKLASQYGCILIAKNARTIVTDGNRVMINSSGSDALATAGSGDILAGILGAFSCVCKDKFFAAYYAVYLHGLAGEYAAANKSNFSVTATDILDGICGVIKEVM